MNASARGELPSQEQAAAEAGPVKFGEYTFKDGRWYSPNGMALGDFASDSMTKASGIDTSQPGPQAANPAGVTDIAHNILDRSDALVADRAAQAGQGRIGRAAKGAADIGAGLLSGYIGARVNPVLGTLAGLATGYATDQMLQGPVSSIGSASPAVEQFGAPPVAPTPKYGLPLAMGVAASAREPRDAATQGSGEEYTDIIGPPPEFNGDAQSPHGESYSDVASPPPTQSQGGRVAYKKGGKVNASVEPLVQDLMSRYKHAKTAETATTKPLLQHHDKAIVTALSIAKKAI
jgi:hypothetical protein